MKKIRYLLFIITVFIFHCSTGADNGELTIYNDCDRVIRVYYTSEYETDGDDMYDDDMYDDDTDEHEINIETAYEAASIVSHSKRKIEVSSGLYSGSIIVVYSGIVREFSVNFDIFDTASIRINKNDFNFIIGK
jgi:hypothetical protein